MSFEEHQLSGIHIKMQNTTSQVRKEDYDDELSDIE